MFNFKQIYLLNFRLEILYNLCELRELQIPSLLEINFEQKSQDKKSERTERAFKIEQKVFLIIFAGFLVARICVRSRGCTFHYFIHPIVFRISQFKLHRKFWRQIFSDFRICNDL